jgi:hypothetical protein
MLPSQWWLAALTPYSLEAWIFGIGLALFTALSILLMLKPKIGALFRPDNKSEPPPNRTPTGTGYLPPIEEEWYLKIGRSRKPPRSYYQQLQPKQPGQLRDSPGNSGLLEPETSSRSGRKD